MFVDTKEELVEWMNAIKKAARIGLAIPLGKPVTDGTDAASYKAISDEATFRQVGPGGITPHPRVTLHHSHHWHICV